MFFMLGNWAGFGLKLGCLGGSEKNDVFGPVESKKAGAHEPHYPGASPRETPPKTPSRAGKNLDFGDFRAGGNRLRRKNEGKKGMKRGVRGGNKREGCLSHFDSEPDL